MLSFLCPCGLLDQTTGCGLSQVVLAGHQHAYHHKTSQAKRQRGLSLLGIGAFGQGKRCGGGGPKPGPSQKAKGWLMVPVGCDGRVKPSLLCLFLYFLQWVTGFLFLCYQYICVTQETLMNYGNVSNMFWSLRRVLSSNIIKTGFFNFYPKRVSSYHRTLA